MFFSPASLRAKIEPSSLFVVIEALIAGPLCEVVMLDGPAGFFFLKYFHSVTALAKGDQVTRYLLLWSLRLVVLVSRVQDVFMKAGSRSSVGAGVAIAQVWDQYPI